jgi:hypothetical protein
MQGALAITRLVQEIAPGCAKKKRDVCLALARRMEVTWCQTCFAEGRALALGGVGLATTYLGRRAL